MEASTGKNVLLMKNGSMQMQNVLTAKGLYLNTQAGGEPIPNYAIRDYRFCLSMADLSITMT